MFLGAVGTVELPTAFSKQGDPKLEIPNQHPHPALRDLSSEREHRGCLGAATFPGFKVPGLAAGVQGAERPIAGFSSAQRAPLPLD